MTKRKVGSSNNSLIYCNDSAFNSLAAAIVAQAIKDYKLAKKEGNTGVIQETIHFFHSQWCYGLCNIDGDRLISIADTHKSYIVTHNI